ncbi:T9SS type A sorting domain-containing protein [Rasiella sp. SM2506]|uniref:T9SS type A sorting domain-containing protein n=1 Tax=Rasiella sp. SM2506 TaxID=3423914 RepID=UPI003D78B339
MKKKFLLILVVACFGTLAFAQENFPPVIVTQGTYLGESQPLRDAPTAPLFTEEITDQFRIDQRFTYTGGLTDDGSPDGFDPLVQTEPPLYGQKNLDLNFDGITVAEAGGAAPPDPSGAVGPDHYVTAVNLSVKIFDKQGNTLVGPVSLNTFFGTSGNGDPIIMYDQLADRFFVSQFRVSNNALLIAVSTTPDPTGTYYVYQYPLSSFPDYPHYSVWPNAYFLTANKGGQTTYAFDREVMLRGGEDPALVGFTLPGVVRNPATVFSPEPANLLGRVAPADAPGYIVYLQDDAWSGVTVDHLKIWTIDLDFDGSSTISAPAEIPVQPFDSFFNGFGVGDFNQPGTGQRIDGISGVISYMANYRSFDTHNSLLVNFNSDVGSQKGAIRWIELRNIGNGPFVVFQEGTYSIADNANRFMGSMGIDKDGNIALAYNVSGTSTFPGIRYTGRMATDPLGTMTFPETTIVDGEGGVNTFNRFGDYAQMTMDIDNLTYWYTGEYIGPTNNFWKTRVASFTLGTAEANDVGVYAFASPLYEGPFTNAETIQAQVSNFGTNSQTGFDIELRVNGTLITTDTYTGTLAPGERAIHVFSETVDLSAAGDYLVSGTAVLAGDTYDENNEFVFKYVQEETILGTNDPSFVNRNLLIYPTTDRTYEIFLSTTADYGDVDYILYDYTGKQIFNGSLNKDSSGYKALVNMNTKAAGVYIVQIQNGSTTMSKKILVK